MKLQKAQLRLIILLNAVLAVLVAAIALECILGDRTLTPSDAEAETPVVSDTPKPEYSLVRKARLSLSDAIDLETNIGGSGDETLVEAYAYDGKLYIFGNTTSSDYDMTDAQGRAFMCVTDEDLSTERFSFFGSGEKLERVIFGEGGFLRSFVDKFFDIMNKAGTYEGKIVVVQPIANGLCDVLNEQKGKYNLFLRGISSGKVSEKEGK